jgi:hypothetical protein
MVRPRVWRPSAEPRVTAGQPETRTGLEDRHRAHNPAIPAQITPTANWKAGRHDTNAAAQWRRCTVTEWVRPTTTSLRSQSHCRM